MPRQTAIMRDIPHELSSGPFTIQRAYELGLSPKLLRGPRFRTPWPGVRVLREHPDTFVERCRAASLVLPTEATFTHHTALVLGGWLTPQGGRYRPEDPSPGTSLHVSVPMGTARPRGRGLVAHQWYPEPDDVVGLAGLRVSSPARTWCDLGAADEPLTDLVILADALRRRGVGVGRLRARLDAWEGRRGALVLRTALRRSRDRVDSPMETRLRLLLEGAGLPEPMVNEWVKSADGTPLHCPDLSWPQWRVAVDYDGRHHNDRDDERDVSAGRASDWRARQDQSRRDLLAEDGWAFRVFTSFDVFRQPAILIERVRRALSLAGAPV